MYGDVTVPVRPCKEKLLDYEYIEIAVGLRLWLIGALKNTFYEVQ